MLRLNAAGATIHFLLLCVILGGCPAANSYVFKGITGSRACRLSSRSAITNARKRTLRLSATVGDGIKEWVVQQGSRAEDIKVSFQQNSDTGDCYTVAEKDIAPNEALFSLPINACLDASKAFASLKSVSGLTPDKLRTGSLGMLALFLLSEKQRGDASQYAAYVNTLPKLAPGVLSWDEKALGKLFTSTTRKVVRQIEAIDADSSFLRSLAQQQQQQQDGKITSSPLPSESELSTERFRWAMGIVKSKCVSVEGKLMLVPGMDCIENSPFATNEPYTGNAGVFGAKVVKVSADREYKSGERVVMSYGLKSSAESLEDHGVVPDVALTDSSCEFAVTIDGSEKFADDKLNILEDNQLSATLRVDLEASDGVEIDPDLIRFLRLKLIAGKDAYILEPCFMNTVFETLGSPFSKPNEIAVFEYIKDTCASTLDRMNAEFPPEQDVQILGSGSSSSTSSESTDPNHIDVLLARLRQQERAALQQTIRNTDEEIASIQGPLDPHEYYQERRLRELDLLRPLDDEEVFMPGDRIPVEDDY